MNVYPGNAPEALAVSVAVWFGAGGSGATAMLPLTPGCTSKVAEPPLVPHDVPSLRVSLTDTETVCWPTVSICLVYCDEVWSVGPATPSTVKLYVSAQSLCPDVSSNVMLSCTAGEAGVSVIGSPVDDVSCAEAAGANTSASSRQTAADSRCFAEIARTGPVLTGSPPGMRALDALDGARRYSIRSGKASGCCSRARPRACTSRAPVINAPRW